MLARPFRYPVRWLAFLAGGIPGVLVFPGPSLSYVAWLALVPGMAAREVAVGALGTVYAIGDGQPLMVLAGMNVLEDEGLALEHRLGRETLATAAHGAARFAAGEGRHGAPADQTG